MANGDYVKSVTSGNSSVVRVVKYTKKGKIKLKALKKGTATLTITLAGGTKKTVKVKVQKTTVKTTKISGLSKKMTVKKGTKTTLKPVITPITSQQKITCTSSNKKVAAVTSKGVIKAKKAGKVKITVKSGSKKFCITVTVR